MEKFLYFNDADNDVAMYPVSRIQSITCATNLATLIKFAPGSLGEGQAGSVDIITLTHTAGGEIPLMKALARAINATGPGYSDGLIVVADDIEGVYLVPEVTDAAIALDA
tara:strand:+ start:136 stop:465 length:330 start_codon:yes stop_codon:yes gene_type:complete